MILGLALGTCCTRGLKLGPQDSLHSWPRALPSGPLAVLVALASPRGTCCARGLGLCPQDLLCLWPQALPLGYDGVEDAKNKRWAESVGTDIAQGRGGEDNNDDNNDNGEFNYGKNVIAQRMKRQSKGRGGGGGCPTC